LASDHGGQRQFLQLQRGATKVGLGLDDIRAIVVPLPPRDEQDAIVDGIDRLFSVLDEQEAAVDRSRKRAARLRQAILKRVFEGKLVPQDPNDEPASVLLERIKNERQTMAAKVETGKKNAIRKTLKKKKT